MSEENNNTLYVEKVNHDTPLDHLSEEDVNESYTVYVKVKTIDGEKQYVLKDKKTITLGNHPEDDVPLSNATSFSSHVTLELKNNQFILNSLPSKTKIIHQDETSIKLFIGLNEVLLNLNKPQEISEKNELNEIKPEVYHLLTQSVSSKQFFREKLKTVFLLILFLIPNIFFYFMNTDHEISDLNSTYNSASTSIDFFLIFIFYALTFINYKKHYFFGIAYKYWMFKLFNKFMFYEIILSVATYYLSKQFADEISLIYNLGIFFLSFLLMENWFQLSIFDKKKKFILRILCFLLLMGWFTLKMSTGVGGYIML